MKGGNNYRMKGRHLSLMLITLLFTTIFISVCEKNPFVTIVLPVQDQFTWPSSASVEEAENYSSQSIRPKEHIQEKNSESITAEETKEPGEENLDTQLINFTTPSIPSRKETDEEGIFSTKKKVCNYAKGSWVADSRRPLYSGLGCKQWLSGMWACRLTQRKDFSYEKYRWQPKDCEMPEFERSAFLRRMKDKTIAFVGDSLGRQQFQSMMCMASGGQMIQEVEDVGREYSLVKLPGHSRPDGWAYRFLETNTTILYYWSSTLADLVPLNSLNAKSGVAMHLDRPPAFMSKHLHQFDVLVLNTGHHWNRGKLRANRWVVYVHGKPSEDERLANLGNAKNFTVYSVARWLDSQLPSHPRLKAFFRTISPRHFRNGDWDTGGSCDSTTPLTRGNKVEQHRSSDEIVEAAIKGTRIKLLDITALSELRDEGHISRYSIKANQGVHDCLHWCLPGIPDTWNELLAAQV